MPHPYWEHPDWYDVHDNTCIAGPDREPEHYREFVIALPPIGAEDHVADVGAGTGKLSHLIDLEIGDMRLRMFIDSDQSISQRLFQHLDRAISSQRAG